MTQRKGKSSSQPPFLGSMLVFGGVQPSMTGAFFIFMVNNLSKLQTHHRQDHHEQVGSLIQCDRGDTSHNVETQKSSAGTRGAKQT